MLRPWIPTDLTNDGTEIIWLVADDKENVYSTDGVYCTEIKNKGNYGSNAVTMSTQSVYLKTNKLTLNNRKVLSNGDIASEATTYKILGTNEFSRNIYGWCGFCIYRQDIGLAASSTGTLYKDVICIDMPDDEWRPTYGWKSSFVLELSERGASHASEPGVLAHLYNYRKNGSWSSYHQFSYKGDAVFNDEPTTMQNPKWCLSLFGFNYGTKTMTQYLGDKVKVDTVTTRYTDFWNPTYNNAVKYDIGVMGSVSPSYGTFTGGRTLSFAEMVLVRRAIRPEDIILMQGYLAHEWGLTDQLPEGHPYKTERPMIDDTNIGTYVRKVCDDITTVFEVAWSGSSNENGIYIIKQKELNLSTLQKPIYHGVQVEGNWVLVIDGLTVDENMSKITTTVRFECPDKTYVVKQKQLTVNLTWS